MKVGILPRICLILVLNCSLDIKAQLVQENESRLQAQPGAEPSKTKGTLITASIYAKLFKERRMEQNIIIKQMLKSTYEKNFELLKLAYAKIFEVINENNATLTNHDYSPHKGFPESPQLQEASTLTLENCCIAAESVLHFPEISYRIFRKMHAPNWKPFLNWCIHFVTSLPHLIDESTVKLMELLQQEINEELRAHNYVNPYYTLQLNSHKVPQQKKKSPKKLKKGPHLSGRNEL